MERLTYEQVIERTEKLKTAKIYASKEEYFALDEIIQPMLELQKYKKLEEQIGCPLEVRCKIYDSNYVYTKDGEKWIITYTDETHFIAVYDKAITHDRKFTYSDHKKTWWLKADKSE